MAAKKHVAYVLMEVRGEDAESIKAELEKEAPARSVVVVAESLRQLAHPVHLEEANRAFGNIGEGGKAAR